MRQLTGELQPGCANNSVTINNQQKARAITRSLRMSDFQHLLQAWHHFFKIYYIHIWIRFCHVHSRFPVGRSVKNCSNREAKYRSVSYGWQKQQQNTAELLFSPTPDTLIGQYLSQSMSATILLARTCWQARRLGFRTRVNLLVRLNVNQTFLSLIGLQVC